MSELRQDPTTREWVIIAPERAKRPKQAAKKKPAVKLPAWDAACPFCTGNEDQTPEEVFRLPATSQGPAWDVRVVPNRFAALMPEGDTTRQRDGHFFHKMNGFGVHEVIIENPVHNVSMALMTCEQLEKVLITYQERYNDLKKKPETQVYYHLQESRVGVRDVPGTPAFPVGRHPHHGSPLSPEI